jgi:hypothetical protein
MSLISCNNVKMCTVELQIKCCVWNLLVDTAFTSRKEIGLKVFENNFLQRISDCNKVELNRKLEKLHKEKPQPMYCSPRLSEYYTLMNNKYKTEFIK